MGSDESNSQAHYPSQSLWRRELSDDRLAVGAVIVLTWIAVGVCLILMEGAEVVAGAFALIPVVIARRWLADYGRKGGSFSPARILVGLHLLICVLLLVQAVIVLARMRRWL